jgi:hypothetical protein
MAAIIAAKLITICFLIYYPRWHRWCLLIETLCEIAVYMGGP